MWGSRALHRSRTRDRDLIKIPEKERRPTSTSLKREGAMGDGEVTGNIPSQFQVYFGSLGKRGYVWEVSTSVCFRNEVEEDICEVYPRLFWKQFDPIYTSRLWILWRKVRVVPNVLLEVMKRPLMKFEQPLLNQSNLWMRPSSNLHISQLTSTLIQDRPEIGSRTTLSPVEQTWRAWYAGPTGSHYSRFGIVPVCCMSTSCINHTLFTTNYLVFKLIISMSTGAFSIVHYTYDFIIRHLWETRASRLLLSFTKLVLKTGSGVSTSERYFGKFSSSQSWTLYFFSLLLSVICVAVRPSYLTFWVHDSSLWKEVCSYLYRDLNRELIEEAMVNESFSYISRATFLAVSPTSDR